MHPLETPPATPRRFRRRLLLVLLALVAAVVLAVGLALYLGDRALREAVAEADRLDPGWRFEDLERARAEIPDADNSAPLVLAAAARLPGAVPAPPTGANPGLEERLARVPLPQRPPPELIEELRQELIRAAPALDLARDLADRPRGRHAITWSKDLVGTLVPHVQTTRDLVGVLALDARRRAVDRDGPDAVRSCAAALNASRSLGDEPTLIAQLVRAACDRRAVQSLEWCLSQTEAPGPALEDFQQALAREAGEPLQLRAIRSERVMLHHSLQLMRAGRFDYASFGLARPALDRYTGNLPDRAMSARCQAPYLHYFNRQVEIAKLPPEEQLAHLDQLTRPDVPLPRLLQALYGPNGLFTPNFAFHDWQAALRTGTAALAAERHRKDTGRWPDSLDVLVPRYLPAVPIDPYDGQPLRFRRLPDGLVIYSVGRNRTDDAGQLNRGIQQSAADKDLGFQLWDVSRRGATD